MHISASSKNRGIISSPSFLITGQKVKSNELSNRITLQMECRATILEGLAVSWRERSVSIIAYQLEDEY